MHGQVKKWVFLAAVHGIVFVNGQLDIDQVLIVFRVVLHPG
jgi:hypothetical protein